MLLLEETTAPSGCFRLMMASVPNGFVASPMDILLPQHLQESALLASGPQPPKGSRERRRPFSLFVFCHPRLCPRGA